MEQIGTIIVSVLSTLGVVALVLTGVVAFRKIKNKADVVDLDARTNELNQRIDQEIDARIAEVDAAKKETDDRLRAIESLIDSRCDRLHNDILAVSKANEHKMSVLTDQFRKVEAFIETEPNKH